MILCSLDLFLSAAAAYMYKRQRKKEKEEEEEGETCDISIIWWRWLLVVLLRDLSPNCYAEWKRDTGAWNCLLSLFCCVVSVWSKCTKSSYNATALQSRNKREGWWWVVGRAGERPLFLHLQLLVRLLVMCTNNVVVVVVFLFRFLSIQLFNPFYFTIKIEYIVSHCRV